MDRKQKLNPDSLEPLDLDATERRVVVTKARRDNIQHLATVLGIAAMAAPPGFLDTAEAMMGSPYKPPVQRQPDNERIAKIRAAEEKRQRRRERNKRNRPIRGSL